MLYLFYGDNIDKTRRKCGAFLQKLFEKKPNASFFEMTPDNFEQTRVKELLYGQGLFENEYAVLLKGVFELPEVEDFIVKNIQLFSDSPNVFVFLEREIGKRTEAIFAKHAARLWKIDDAGKKYMKKEFNVFLLADAFANKDKKRAWALLYHALKERVPPENIHGILFWQIKNMLLVSSAGGKNPGLSPFVFQKTKHALRHYSHNELTRLSAGLVSLYHDARRGAHDMDIALEQFILSL